MPDQAEELRKLVSGAAPRVGERATLPPTIVVTGGKGGVGATTVAINLSAALVQNGRRTVLVDAAPQADAAKLLGLDVEQCGSLEDLLSGARTAAEVLCAGPAGISLVGGKWAAERSPDRSQQSFARLVDALASLTGHVDALVIDSGSGVTSWTRSLWQEAALVLLVTTPDDVAVMDAYATIKRGSWEEANLDLRVLVNACHDTATAVDVQSRLAAACRRFLGLSIGRAPLVSRHFAELDAISAPPLAWETSAAPFAGNIKQLGRFAADVLAQRRRAIGTRGRGPVCVNFIRPGTLSLDSSELPREFSRC